MLPHEHITRGRLDYCKAVLRRKHGHHQQSVDNTVGVTMKASTAPQREVAAHA
ncbi:protector from prophage-induced early lysis [Salmonella phage 21]|nr:protector from prophage-induced early lysis [Salmonella phage 21]